MFRDIRRTAVAEFELAAMGPVLISSGISTKTDPTLPDNVFLTGRTDSDGTLAYVIPGSSIKGVIRHNCSLIGDRETSLFGTVSGGAQKSRVSFHDAYADMDTIVTGIRAQTAISPHIQSAKSSSLNNVQNVEKGNFKAGFKLLNFADDELFSIIDVLVRINSGEVRFGGRKSRGFGFMNVKNFSLRITNGFNSDLSAKDEIVLDSLDEAFFHFGKEE